MIVVKPANQQSAFYFATLQPDKQVQPVYTDKCFRCFSGMLVMQKKASAKPSYPDAGVYVWHILPGSNNYTDSISKHLFERIIWMSKSYDFKILYRCGGMLDTQINEYRYHLMKRKLEMPFRHLFPDLEIIGDEPTKETLCMSLLFTEKMEIILKHEKA